MNLGIVTIHFAGLLVLLISVNSSTALECVLYNNIVDLEPYIDKAAPTISLPVHPLMSVCFHMLNIEATA